MVLPTILKRKHNLKEGNILRVLKKMRMPNSVKALARVTSTRRTEDMSLVEVKQQVEDLTGEDFNDIMLMAGKEVDDADAARLLLHHIIITSNERGQPRGQDLQNSQSNELAAAGPSQEPGETGQLPKRRRLDNNNMQTGRTEKLPVKDKDELTVDLMDIDHRILDLERRKALLPNMKKKGSLKDCLVSFLNTLPGKPLLHECSPNDVLRFLVWKDIDGKTRVHDVRCSFLGSKEKPSCNCPVRLASGTISVYIQYLVDIFCEVGRGRFWDVSTHSGNPAVSPSVRDYLKMIQEEQARAHVLPKQASPIFLSKVKVMSEYIYRELARKDLSLRERFVYLGDQAWLKLQFFGGDRASDLAGLVAQDVRILGDGTGLVLNHTYGKTLRGVKGKTNMFVIKKCEDDLLCPVKGLQDYVNGSKKLGVVLSPGFLFRVVSDSGRVLDQAVSYSVVYERLRTYLTTLGIYEGETPHSFRSGCAITMALSGSVKNVGQMMRHIGWFGEQSAQYYSRLPVLKESAFVASKLADCVDQTQDIESSFREGADFKSLKQAF